MKKLPAKKPRFLCEELEPRILLSAGFEGLILDSSWETDAPFDESTDVAQIVALFDNNQTSSLSEPTVELVFIDSSLPDSQSLIDDLASNGDVDRHFEIILLNNDQDGISHITATLQSYEHVDAVHFVTHGEDGKVQLGGTLLDKNNVNDYTTDFGLWKDALDQEADILFYGCNLASSDNGLDLIQTISELTDADVAASDDTTGNIQLDGDWELEQEIGLIETNIAFSYSLQDNWMGILPVITFQDGVNGYTGTVDTQIDQLTPNSIYNNDADISVDGGASQKQGLIRFDNIFGGGANQIPYGSTINSATLTFNVTNTTLNGSNNVEMYAMLVSWNDSATWNSFSSVGNNTAGIQADGTDAASGADSALGNPKNATGVKDFTGLENTIQTWSDGGTNYGWVIINDSTNNWNFSQSHDADITNPILTVDYTTNADPVFTSSNSASVAENTPATTTVLTVTATDADGDTPTFSITGATADDALFSITPGGVLTFNAAPDFENPGDIGGNNVYDIEVTANDGNGGLTTQNIAITVTNVNEGAPVITSSATQTVAENSTAVTTVTATDVDNDTITYSITGVTADDALFSITPGGVLTFNAAPDFENPGDIGGNNVYDIEVTADDGNGGLTTQNIAITVTNVNEGAPVITSSATQTVAENSTAVTTVTATDVDNDTITYSITGVTADDALFSITPGGVLTFNAAPDFENPGDIGGNNVYDIEVTADDGNGGLTTQNIAITVTNVNENPVITSGSAPIVTENNSQVITVTATDVDGDIPTYSITGGADSALFSIDNLTGALSFNTAPDFESPSDFDANNIYDIQITANDGNGGTATQNISITVINSNELPTIYDQQFQITGSNISSGTIVGTITGSDIDAGDTLSYSITDGSGAGIFAINNTTGEISIINSGALNNNVAQAYSLAVTVTDGSGATSQAVVTITVFPTADNSIPTSNDTTPSNSENSGRIDLLDNPVDQQDNAYIYIRGHKPIDTLDQAVPVNENLPVEKIADKFPPRDTSSESPIKSALLSLRGGGGLIDALNAMKQDIDKSIEKGDDNGFRIAMQSTGIVLTAGFASWVLRGGSILASFLSTMPIWRGLDPLPILAAAKNDPKKVINVTDAKKDETNHDDVDSIFANQSSISQKQNSDDAEQGKSSD